MGSDEELVKARTATYVQGPGFMMRQCTDVLMEESVANALSEMMESRRKDEQTQMKGNIEELAGELMRVTKVLGDALTQLAANSQKQDQQMVNELQAWTAGLETELN